MPTTWRQQVMAANLAAGATAVASSTTAAALWGFDTKPHLPIHLTVEPTSGARHGASICTHRHHLLESDRATTSGIAVTSPTRTVIDAAATLDIDALEVVLDASLRSGRTSIRRIEHRLEQFDRAPKGTPRLRRLLAIHHRDHRPTMSRFETLFRQLIRGAGLPEPVTQYEVRVTDHTRYLDFAYPDAMVAIETDSRLFHGTSLAWRADAHRATTIAAMGWRVLRITWDDLVARPEHVIDVVTRAIAVGRKTG